jgi:CubicO group peptidase (beta-lactamase class C family)
MKKLLTAACLFVATVVASVSFIVQAVIAQAPQALEAKPLIDDTTAAKVDKLFENWDKPDSPGCALGIVKDGRLIYKRGYGMANLDYNIPISSKSAFDIQSMAKQFTAMSVLLLAKQGKLSLDDEIQKYLPDFPRYQSPITIRHLIHHTSGIRDHWVLHELAGMRGENVHLTEYDFLGLLARQKDLNFKPGEGHAYSNSGYFLLGLIVKKVSGKSLREFTAENIFKPLGMNNTHFHDDRNMVVKNRVSAYLPRSSGGFAAALLNAGTVGDGNLFTSVEDLFLWDQNFYNNKLGFGSDLISEQLSTGKLNNGQKLNYAFGLRVEEYKGLRTIRHGGSGSGFDTDMTRFPEEKFSVICLCNEGDNLDSGGFRARVADIFLADQYKKLENVVKENVAAPDVPDNFIIHEKELASLTGLYVDPTYTPRQLRFYLEGGKLFFRAGPSVERRLSPISQSRFKVIGVGAFSGVEMVFEQPIAGGPLQVKVIGPYGTTTLEAVNGETPTLVQLSEFSGKYVSDELPGATYTLSIKDGKLLLQIRNGITVFSDRAFVLAFSQTGNDVQKDVLLTPLFADAFTFLGSTSVRFTRNRHNAISGFALTAGSSVRNLRFHKQ